MPKDGSLDSQNLPLLPLLLVSLQEGLSFANVTLIRHTEEGTELTQAQCLFTKQTH